MKVWLHSHVRLNLSVPLVRFSLSAPVGICEGTQGDLCVVLETEIEREATVDMTIMQGGILT